MQTNKNREKNSDDVENVTEYNELAAVSTDVLAYWVTDSGRCLWESTAAGPIPWTGDDDEDRQTAVQMCAGCPMRAECLELETRAEQGHVDRAWDEVHPLDRAVLLDVWSARYRSDVEATIVDENGAGQ